MFGKKETIEWKGETLKPEDVMSHIPGTSLPGTHPLFEHKVTTHMKVEGKDALNSWMVRMGSDGWELVAAMDKPLGFLKAKGDEAFCLFWKRLVVRTGEGV